MNAFCTGDMARRSVIDRVSSQSEFFKRCALKTITKKMHAKLPWKECVKIQKVNQDGVRDQQNCNIQCVAWSSGNHTHKHLLDLCNLRKKWNHWAVNLKTYENTKDKFHWGFGAERTLWTPVSFPSGLKRRPFERMSGWADGGAITAPHLSHGTEHRMKCLRLF